MYTAVYFLLPLIEKTFNKSRDSFNKGSENSKEF